MKLSRARWLALWLGMVLLSAGLLLVACGEEEEEEAAATPTTAAEERNLAEDQVFRARIVGEPETLDPQKGGFATDITILRQLFRGLVYFDEDLNPVAAAAEEVPTVENGGISEDGLTYTFKLRDDLKWSDGSPLTANDFEYSLKRFFDPSLGGNQYYQSFYYDIEGAQEYHTALGTEEEPKTPSEEELAALRDAVAVKALDDRTLEIRLTKPRPTFLQLMALWGAYPVKQSVIEELGDQWIEGGNMVSDGPFVLAEWSHNARIVLERNPNYWGDPPTLERIEFLMIPDETTAFQAYRNNELDYTIAPPAQVKELQTDPEFRAEPELTTFALEYNNEREPFTDPLVRKAFAKAIDRDAYIEVVRQGIGMADTAWIPPGMPGYDPEAGTALAFDPEAAKQLLADAGYPDGQGLPKVTLTVTTTEIARLSAEFTKEQLSQNLGVEIDIESLDPGTYEERYGASEFQVVFGGWTADYPHPENWIPELFGTGATTNQYKYSNPEVDDLIAQAATELDPDEVIRLYQEAQRIILDEDAGIAPIYHRVTALMLKSYVKGLVYTGTDGDVRGDVFLSSPDVYIEAH